MLQQITGGHPQVLHNSRAMEMPAQTPMIAASHDSHCRPAPSAQSERTRLIWMMSASCFHSFIAQPSTHTIALRPLAFLRRAAES